MTDAGLFPLAALLLHAAAFVLLAVIVPLRRSGRPAAMVSILCATGSFASAVQAWRTHGGETLSRLVWEWLPSQGETLATIGVLADADSTVMLCLVGLVSLLVQVYSLG